MADIAGFLEGKITEFLRSKNRDPPVIEYSVARIRQSLAAQEGIRTEPDFSRMTDPLLESVFDNLPLVVVHELKAIRTLLASGAVMTEEDRACAARFQCCIEPRISFQNCQITDAGARAIAELLTNNTIIEQMSLAKNKIGNAGMALLADAIASNHTLQQLTLDENEITDEGGAKLADALARNDKLNYLSLAYTKGVGDQTAIHFAEALTRNRTLTSLRLNNTMITDAGAERLAAALVPNVTLMKLHLSNCKIGEAGVAHFQAAFRAHPEIPVGDDRNDRSVFVTSGISPLSLPRRR